MAMFYMRTRKEAVDEGFLCAEPCEHIDCASWAEQTTQTCRYCRKRAAGHWCMIEDGRLVHANCVMAEVN